MDDMSAGEQVSDVAAADVAAADVAARELAEFSTFYQASVPRLVTFLVGQGATLADAADCVQQTLVDVLPPVWSTVESPYARCRFVAYRTWCALLRRKAPTERVPELTGFPLLASHHDLDLGDHHPDLRHWLDHLHGDRQRAVLVCSYDGATVAEIAELLDMAPATVSSTLRTARESLRRARSENPLGGERSER